MNVPRALGGEGEGTANIFFFRPSAGNWGSLCLGNKHVRLAGKFGQAQCRNALYKLPCEQRMAAAERHPHWSHMTWLGGLAWNPFEGSFS